MNRNDRIESRGTSRRGCLVLLATLVLGLASGCGVKVGWEEKEATAESHAQYVASVEKLLTLRAEGWKLRNAAEDALAERDEPKFQKTMDELKSNLDSQVTLIKEAREATTSHEVKRKADLELLNVQTDLDSFTEIAAVWRKEQQVRDWRKVQRALVKPDDE